MKKANLKAYLIALFCLMVFAGFTQAQIKNAPLNRVAEADSNEIELARQKNRLRVQKQREIKKWRKLKPGMTEEQMRRILGEPKLIQSGSHERTWFYQDLPVSNAKPNFRFREGGKKQKVATRYGTVVEKIGMSDVGGVKDGFVFFEAKSINSLIEEEKARCDKAIKKANEKYGGGGPLSHPPGFGDNVRVVKLKTAMREAAVEKAEKDYDRRVKKLRRSPPPPVLRFFNQPDWEQCEDILANKKPLRIQEKPIENWKRPLNWRRLKINMTVNRAHAILGEPERREESVEGRREYYGDVSDHGELYFVARSDLKEYLDSWVEPFWPRVEQQSLQDMNEVNDELKTDSKEAGIDHEPEAQQRKIVMPKYMVLNEDIYDIPLKTQVELNILVSGEISESGLRALLNKLYTSIKKKKGFKYHSSPTNIYIYSYTSKERFESGMGQWIAMLEKSYNDVSPSISVNRRQITQLGVKPEEKLGFSEKERKEIWKELVLIGDRVWKEAEEQYPFNPELSQSQFRKQAGKLTGLRERLEKEYQNKLAKKYSLTLKQLEEISMEGITKDWALTKLQ